MTSLAHKYRIPLDKDFHALTSAEVERVLAAADERKYRKPKNANGSRARYFHASMVRASLRK
jgi:hypothetical protein